MTFEEIMKRLQSEKPRRKPKDEEHKLQTACVGWFRQQYPNSTADFSACLTAEEEMLPQGQGSRLRGFSPEWLT